jgi:hypothetical protein
MSSTRRAKALCHFATVGLVLVACSVATQPAAAATTAASFTASPASPVTGSPVTFDATGSTCGASPCSYAWSDDGSPTRPSHVLYPLGSGATLPFTFQDVGTKYVRLVVTDAVGTTATVEHNVQVGPSPTTASFTYSPSSPVTALPVTFDGSASNCGAAPCSYAWSDDGSPTRPSQVLYPLGSGPTLQFTFQGVGTKYVRLVVTDALGRAATVEQNVPVGQGPLPPTASFAYSPSSPVTGSPVSFDASTSVCTSAPCSYSWSDDGSPTRPSHVLYPLGSGPTLQFTFQGVGTKYVRLVVTDALGRAASVEQDVQVGTSIVPAFTSSPAAPETGSPVTFDASGTVCGIAPCSYSWSDDGSSHRPSYVLYPLGSGQILPFTFQQVGTKFVRLVVTDGAGNTATVEHDVQVGPATTARFSYSPNSPMTGSAMTFDASASTCGAAPCSYAWSDDGSSARPSHVLYQLGAGQTMQFTFRQVGIKYVRLVVTDAFGRTDTVEQDVVVMWDGGGGSVIQPSLNNLLVLIIDVSGTPTTISTVLGNDGYSFTWTSPGGGVLMISWSVPGSGRHAPTLIAKGSSTYRARGTHKVKVSLTRAGKRILQSTGRVKVIQTVSFTRAGHKTTVTKTITIRPARQR